MVSTISGGGGGGARRLKNFDLRGVVVWLRYLSYGGGGGSENFLETEKLHHHSMKKTPLTSF